MEAIHSAPVPIPVTIICKTTTKTKRDFYINEDYKLKLIPGFFHFPLFRTFLTLGLSGFVTYCVIAHMNKMSDTKHLDINLPVNGSSNVSNMTAAAPPKRFYESKCTDALSCGITALAVQLLIILPVALCSLSSGCQVLSEDEVTFSAIKNHMHKVLAWTIIAVTAVVPACYLSKDDPLIMYSMAPPLGLNLIELLMVFAAVWDIRQNKEALSWNGGKELIATNEQWRSLLQCYENDLDLEFQFLDKEKDPTPPPPITVTDSNSNGNGDENENKDQIEIPTEN